MITVTLRAHLDGAHICLDEPFELRPDVKMVVMVLPESDAEWEEEQEALSELGRRSLARAYSDDEPDYSDCVENSPAA